MTHLWPRLPRLYLARHAETVFNAGGRMQGWHRHTPLTSRGIDQARAMAGALRDHLGSRPDIDLWCSSAGRAQQTAALITEALDLDFFDVRLDDRLQEIRVGDWEGRTYADVVADGGPVIDAALGIFSRPAPGGEWYPDIVARMRDWLAQVEGGPRPCLVISHGIASRVLRGLLIGGDPYGDVHIAPEAPQGTVFQIDGATEDRLITGSGSSGAHRQQGL